MHALIIADIEGIATIYDLGNVKECAEVYTREIKVYINTLIESGISEITVCDAHDQGNLISPLIAEAWSSSNCRIRLVSRIENLHFNKHIDFAILVGFHGMHGSPGILPHTLRFDFKKIVTCNIDPQFRIPIGEVELYSRWLGAHGIPVIMVAGDREAVYEANCFNPYRLACCTKSYFERMAIGENEIHHKLSACLKSSIGLNWDLCISNDDSTIEVEFNNRDMPSCLNRYGYKPINNSLQFVSCSDLVSKLYPLIDALNEINRSNLNLNIEFIKEARILSKDLDIEIVRNSNVGLLLSKSIHFLDSDSRIEILRTMSALRSRNNGNLEPVNLTS